MLCEAPQVAPREDVSPRGSRRSLRRWRLDRIITLRLALPQKRHDGLCDLEGPITKHCGEHVREVAEALLPDYLHRRTSHHGRSPTRAGIHRRRRLHCWHCALWKTHGGHSAPGTAKVHLLLRVSTLSHQHRRRRRRMRRNDHGGRRSTWGRGRWCLGARPHDGLCRVPGCLRLGRT